MEIVELVVLQHGVVNHQLVVWQHGVEIVELVVLQHGVVNLQLVVWQHGVENL